VRDGLARILSTAHSASGLTKQLLVFSRQQRVSPVPVDVGAAVEGVREILTRTLGDNIRLEVDLQPLPPVLLDPSQLEQIVLNLAINARDAMPTGGTLTIETANIVLETPAHVLPGLLPGHYVMLSVSDTGIGMSTEVQRRAFEPFFTTKEVGKGTGLGLASAHGIVRQAHGQIFLSSELARGSCLRIYLPRSMSEESPLESAPPSLPHGRGHETVLVVEDHDMVREMVVHALQGQGYAVLAASSGPSALELVRSLESELDLVVADIVMPRMSGLELAAQLLEEHRELPVLYMSGYSEQIASGQSRAVASHALLQKPFTSTELVNKVREVLDRSVRSSGVVGPLVPAGSSVARVNQP
jgi:CheY-like chemotaxis protein